MLTILKHIVISADELEFTAIRAQGSGGQNVNKVSSAIHLRFDIKASSLPGFYKERLLEFKDKRITADGIIVIKAQTFRTQQKNREDALERLKILILDATTIQKNRRPTKPTRSSQRKRMDSKTKRGNTKAMRGKVM
ncbi:alternative ribosome rescue aminoacyl-tRNA hydrolase ArfB [Neptunomonas sp. CHC150]|uniref:alternative ribosome rescue aminoacyl-tRNA hydrolase ArfB n=1 Tax=Neptunomonas sp. CHC150 TaxID=2998324 RepID=UPI0025B185EF|nr:alternative ribosome rescue aminoacyl-tRNA hydrolase ArfB [Neptunomonas sp. CHC150]MDN2661655.1 alternative ribosome rescue aminoacyl-tRNA hydrolase ArfB [Neptunomonas sp. CHC150]